MPSNSIKSRLVLYFPGFEASDSIAQLGRLKYSADKTSKIWNFNYQSLAAEAVESAHCGILESETSGTDWKVDTRIVARSAIR